MENKNDEPSTNTTEYSLSKDQELRFEVNDTDKVSVLMASKNSGLYYNMCLGCLAIEVWPGRSIWN